MKKVFFTTLIGFSSIYTPSIQAETTSEIQALEERVAQLEALVVSLQDQAEDQQALHEHVTVEPDPNVQGGYVVKFNGVNVQINNGVSTGAVNGLGNLFVGFNDLRAVDAFSDWTCSKGYKTTESDCLSAGGVWAVNHKSGSHNVIVGPRNNYSSREGIVTGNNNGIYAVGATVSGGQGNMASATYSSVAGGRNNTASGYGSVVSGGMDNKATGWDSSVSGGRYNQATNYYSSVTAGSYNEASGNYSSITAGRNNIAAGEFASVTGGYSNTASGNRSSVSGGHHNESSGGASSVSGGWSNEAATGNSSILGGNQELTVTQDQRIPQ